MADGASILVEGLHHKQDIADHGDCERDGGQSLIVIAQVVRDRAS